jgi:glutamate racemase
MMKDEQGLVTITFFDSGVGGLPYLQAAREVMPYSTMHYLADDAGFPYGTKSPGQVRDFLFDRVRRLKARFQPDAIVIACDTASQIALNDLRSAYPDTAIIGTSPPIQKAADSTKTGKIGILATARIIEGTYLDDMIARHASDVETVRVPAQDLVSFVEYRYLYSNPDERRAAVEPYIKYLLEQGVDRIVLACTHFLHLKADFEECISEAESQTAMDSRLDMSIVDSIYPVTEKLIYLLAEGSSVGKLEDPERLRNESTTCPRGKDCLLLTREPPFMPMYSLWAKRFYLAGPESL